MYKQINKKAFTLAEVLITLLIIGVISSIVIPSLIIDMKDQQYKVAWKKTYSVLSQASSLQLQANAGSFVGVFTSNGDMLNEFSKSLNVVKWCYSSPLGVCWPNSVRYLYGGTPFQPSAQPSFILNDGTMVAALFNNTTCTSTYSSCGAFRIDINGFKGPNQYGKDQYYIWVNANRILPFGSQGDPYSPATTCIEGNTDVTNTGMGCAAKYLYQ
ncbi:MAG: prepilin-type N-terminal cleavage/methylation domain-containing protein [Candidatus Gastranaerophilales bacterium]|nr:prepilin-type N-terminal cleavage/methylation domain-containing protein [Candidatus Gastranaerophilales bacterium]